MFTVLFAVARTVGWVAQWNEMIEDPNQRIGRPRQLYTGPNKRNYVKLNNLLLKSCEENISDTISNIYLSNSSYSIFIYE